MSFFAGGAFSTLTNLILFVALGLVIGAASTRWLVIPTGHLHLERRTAGTGLSAALCLVLAMAMVFVRQLAEFRDPYAPWQEDAELLLGTGWGTVWKWGAAASVAMVMAYATARRGLLTGWAAAALLALGLGAFPAFTGHASGGSNTLLTLPADTLHVWTVGAWIGGLAVILVLARDTSEDALKREPLRLLIPRFSPLALASVAVLALTGVVGSWAHVDGPSALWSTTYGRLLLLKLVIVAAVFAVGARNFRGLLPRLREADGPAALRRSAAWEVGLATAVLLVTAILVRTSPS